MPVLHAAVPMQGLSVLTLRIPMFTLGSVIYPMANPDPARITVPRLRGD
jgi:hypothetical protein